MEIGLWLGENVISDLRYRKIMLYASDEETITGMKIV